jgi:hypothetical protein
MRLRRHYQLHISLLNNIYSTIGLQFYWLNKVFWHQDLKLIWVATVVCTYVHRKSNEKINESWRTRVRSTGRATFFAEKRMTILSFVLSRSELGCQIFPGTIYPNREKIYQMTTKLPIRHKIYQICSRNYGHKIYQHFPFQGPPKHIQFGIFGIKINYLAILVQSQTLRCGRNSTPWHQSIKLQTIDG